MGDAPRLLTSNIPESSDFVAHCEGCGQERDEPHAWKDCAERLRGENVALINAHVDLARAREVEGELHTRLTEIVDRNLGTRSTMPIERLVDVLEKELPPLLVQIREDALVEAAEQCESERRACEKLTARFPKNSVHATGVLIADVCARRVRTLLGEDGEDCAPEKGNAHE